MARTGRPREFDEDAVLDAAMELFWSRGYTATSVQDLVEELGIARASLYGAFGDKRGLFLRAVARYVEGTRATAATFAGDRDGGDPVLPRIRAALLAITRQPPGTARGCLLGNTAVELLPADADVGDAVRSGLAALEQGFARALQHARDTGELPDRGDVGAQARLLVVLLEGLQVLARAEPDPARLADAVDAGLAALGGAPAP